MSGKVELPDYEKIFELIKKIGEKSKERALLELEIKFDCAALVIETQSNPKYFINDKPQSMAQIERTLLVLGREGELKEKYTKLALISSELELLRLELSLLNNMIEIWRTQSANERLAIS
jgi:hypothetical protein